MTSVFTVEVERRIVRPADRVLARCAGPEIRLHREAPGGSGMACAPFDTRGGGYEEGVVAPGGEEVGRMPTDIRVLRDGLLVVRGRGVFGGAVAMTMRTTVRVEPEGAGCRLRGTGQMVLLGERPTEARAREGWQGMLDRFEADLAAGEDG